MDALLAAPDPTTWTGRRDHALLLVAAQTGLRVSELIGLGCADVHLGAGAHVSCHGKGRKDRVTPLRAATVDILHAWLTERAGAPADPLYPDPTRPTTQPRRRRAPDRPPHRQGGRGLPDAA